MWDAVIVILRCGYSHPSAKIFPNWRAPPESKLSPARAGQGNKHRLVNLMPLSSDRAADDAAGFEMAFAADLESDPGSEPGISRRCLCASVISLYESAGCFNQNVASLSRVMATLDYAK